MLPIGIATLIIAMGLTWIVTPAVIRLGRWLGAVDRPGGRKIHREPIPRIGGLAVYCGYVGALVFAASATASLWTAPSMVDVDWRGLALAASGILIVGLVDDLWGLSWRWKFAAQILAAAYIWTCGFRIDIVSNPLGGALDLGVLSLPLTILWIVLVTNAVNLIDGLDGLATGTALIITGTLAAIAFVQGELGVSASSVALSGSLIGFLCYNYNPARVFLGDSGSMFLGFVLAVTSVRASHKASTLVAILVPVLILGLPLLDTGLAVLRRLLRLRNGGLRSDNSTRYLLRNLGQVFMADREHIHHRLLEVGLSHRRAVVLLYGVGAVFAGVAFAVMTVDSAWVATILALALIGLTAVLLGLLRLGMRRAVEAARGPGIALPVRAEADTSLVD